MIRNILISGFVFLLFGLSAQTNKARSYHPPLNIPLTLAANFGELRPNHFHMGVDFKTNGVEGLPLYAIESGFISRIKVSPYGYGKVIYIDHPNGVTSVYAHCSGFKGKIDSLVRTIQQQIESTEIDVYFSPKDLPVKRGEIIALSGNTGHSSAPHLHFELRDTKTEDALNPLLNGFPIADHREPEIKGMKVYALNEDGFQIPGRSKYVKVVKGVGGFRVPGDVVKVPANFCSEKGGIGFSFDVIDFFDASMNVCGLYGSTLKRNEMDTIFCQRIDQISFDHSRYINSHKDYHEYKQAKRKLHKSFKTAQNPLDIYPSDELGIIHAKPGDLLSLYYAVFDVKNNSTKLQFTVSIEQGAMDQRKEPFPSETYFHPDSAYHYVTEQVEFYCEKGTFYEPTRKDLSLKGTYAFGDPREPIQEPITVKLRIPASINDKSKCYIAVTTTGGRTHNIDSQEEGDWTTGSSMELGTFKIRQDTLAPTVQPSNFKGSSVAGKTKLTWKVSEYQTNIEDYDLYIDGKWHVLEYETKGDVFIFTKPSNLKGTHKVELIVRDTCGNERKWSAELTF
jgi:hypothetical protein